MANSQLGSSHWLKETSESGNWAEQLGSRTKEPGMEEDKFGGVVSSGGERTLAFSPEAPRNVAHLGPAMASSWALRTPARMYHRRMAVIRALDGCLRCLCML